MGPAFHAPLFSAAVKEQDFTTAAKESHMNDAGNRGLIPRNRANALLFENAAAVLEDGGDVDVLYWPKEYAKAKPTNPEGV